MYANPMLWRTFRKTWKKICHTLSVEIDGVRAQKWNYDRVIFYQSFILLCARGINNTKHICTHILFRLDCWNCGAFEKLMKDKFNADTGLLGKSYRIRSKEQRHHTFSNLVLKVILRKAIIFVCARETGGFATQIIGRWCNRNYQQIRRIGPGGKTPA